MNLLESIEYAQMQSEMDVLGDMMDSLYKEYMMISEVHGDVFIETDNPAESESSETESEKETDTDDKEKETPVETKKKKLSTKIIETLKRIWNTIVKYVTKVVDKIKSVKLKSIVKRTNNLSSSDLDRLSDTLDAAEKEIKEAKNKPEVVHEFGDVGFANMRDVSKFVDIDQYEHKMKTMSNNSLTRQASSHAVTLASIFIVSPPILDAIAGTIFAAYTGVNIILFLKDVVNYMKLAVNKHSIYGNIPTMDKIRDAVTSMTEKLSKITMVIPGNPKRITDIRANTVLKQIEIHDSTYHPVFRQIEYFYEKDIKNRKVFRMKMENDTTNLSVKKLSKRDAKSFMECVNFLRGIDLQTQRLFDEFKLKAKMVSETLGSPTINKYAKSNPLMNELMRTSKDAMKMISIFYTFTVIGGDTLKMIDAVNAASKKKNNTATGVENHE